MLAHDLLAQGLTTLQDVAGSTFTVDGVDATFTGVYNRHQYTETAIVGGFEESVDATLLAHKDQFSEVWTPNRCKRLFIQNKAHQVVGVTEDAWSYTLSLVGISK